VQKAVKHGGSGSIFATLNLTPMIDFFTVLVIFLIQNYSASGELMLINEKVAMPKARHAVELARAPIVQITGSSGPNEEGFVLFENQPVIGIRDVTEAKFKDWNITPLKSVLEKAWKKQQAEGGPEKNSAKIIIQSDRRVPFSVIKMVMATCGRNNYTEPNFAIIEGVDDNAQGI